MSGSAGTVAAILFANAIVALALAFWLWRQRNHRAARPLLATTIAALVWIVTYAFEILAVDVEVMLLWANVQFIAIGLAPLFWLQTTLLMIGERPLSRRAVALGLVIPVATVLLAFTSGLHDVFRGPAVGAQLQANMTLLHADYRWFHNAVFVPFQYLVYGFGVFVILRGLAGAHRGFRRGYSVMLAGLAFPLAGGLVYVLDIPPFGDFNPTAVLILATVTSYLIVLPRLHMLDLTPIARSSVVNTLREGIVVLDLRGRIVDVNDAACRLLPSIGEIGSDRLVGMRFRDLVEQHVPLVLIAEGIQQGESAFELQIDGRPHYYLARPAPVVDGGGQQRGLTIAISDITESTELVQSLRAAARDPLTASDVRPVLNRREFLARLATEVQRAQVSGGHITLGVARIDAGSPEHVRSACTDALVGAVRSPVWVAWLDPEVLATLLPERSAEALHEGLLAALSSHEAVVAVHTEAADENLKWQDLLMRARALLPDSAPAGEGTER